LIGMVVPFETFSMAQGKCPAGRGEGAILTNVRRNEDFGYGHKATGVIFSSHSREALRSPLN